nr:hypothetical protein BgiMline_003296 [Biomphalaria glabrata]
MLTSSAPCGHMVYTKVSLPKFRSKLSVVIVFLHYVVIVFLHYVVIVFLHYVVIVFLHYVVIVFLHYVVIVFLHYVVIVFLHYVVIVFLHYVVIVFLHYVVIVFLHYVSKPSNPMKCHEPLFSTNVVSCSMLILAVWGDNKEVQDFVQILANLLQA